MLSRVFFSVFLASAFVSSHALAQSSSSKLDALLACQSITTDAERLACFDDKVGAFSDAAQSGEIVTVEKETIKEIERDSFGFSLPSIPRLSRLLGVKTKTDTSDSEASVAKEGDTSEEVKSTRSDTTDTKTVEKKRKKEKPEDFGTKKVTLTLERVATFDRGKLKFLSSNGQIWEQTDSTKLPKIRLRDDRDVTVEITKGSLGSFFLRVNGKGTAIKVRRIR